jgi:hypothetical protein
VLDHEQAHEKSGRRQRDQERGPEVSDREQEPCRRPQRDEWQCGDREFRDAARVARLDIAIERTAEALEIDRAGMGIGAVLASTRTRSA